MVFGNGFVSEGRAFAVPAAPHRQSPALRTVPGEPSMDLADVVLKFTVDYFDALAACAAFQRQHA